jgi:hypothetical protein
MTALAHEAAQLQHDFAAAILSGSATPAAVRATAGAAAVSRFSVYRNNVIVGLTRALAARYPVVHRLLADDAFAAVARLYIANEPPCSPVLLAWGDTFPAFLRRAGSTAAADYVADIAALESAWSHAYHAAEATSVARERLAALPPDILAQSQFALHPSACWVESRFPIVSVWHENSLQTDGIVDCWRAESALIVRPDAEVGVFLLPEGGVHFCDSIAAGWTVGEAASAAMATCANLDLAGLFTSLFASGAIMQIKPPGTARSRK